MKARPGQAGRLRSRWFVNVIPAFRLDDAQPLAVADFKRRGMGQIGVRQDQRVRVGGADAHPNTPAFSKNAPMAIAKHAHSTVKTRARIMSAPQEPILLRAAQMLRQQRCAR